MNEGKPSIICYLEIPAPNIEKSEPFYRSVFGWTITRSPLTDKPYWEFSTGEGQLSGGLDPNKKPSGEGVILYLKVKDIERTLESVKSAGGVVTRTKFDIGGGYGWSAIFRDPSGNTLGLYETP